MLMPGVTLEVKWDKASEEWLRTLPRRIEASLSSSKFETRVRLALDHYASKVRRAAPRSNTEAPHAGDDWNVLHVRVGHSLTGFLDAIVGSTQVQDPIESLNGPSPWNLPWGLEDGFATHKVWFWNPRAGNRVRRKLVQAVLPSDAPLDKDELAQYLREQKRPPFVTVHGPPRPYVTGTPVDELADELFQAAFEALGEAWGTAG